ncbi:MAG TPA: SDR family NAD(P)-dependent oxidoreductase [Paraburkholderia sp.]|uniref:SDR family NAD(P)-dependent oxidoreductase n=1 Tax=Paraburkholderia sp. TaxID=1926495 RepID=UPI002DEE42B0|nr:SDR family NAD(P)-dependent oxidoreductase [Paraburkholderia sp.]
MIMSELSPSSAPLAWIVGVGASAGLGAALARRFANEGYTVVLTGRTASRIEAIAAEIRAQGGHAVAAAADVTDEAQIAQIAAQVRGQGTLRSAIFNAGNAVRAPTLELETAQFEQAWRTNVLGGFVFARAALPLLLAAPDATTSATGAGSLIFTGATASLRGRPPFAAFASAKAGLRSLSQSLAREFSPRGVHVAHVVIDGGIDGERLRSAAPQRANDAGPDGLLNIDAIAGSYWQLHQQNRSAWTQEIDLRPWREPF